MNEKRGDTGDSPLYKSRSNKTYLGMKSGTFTEFSDLARFFLIHGRKLYRSLQFSIKFYQKMNVVPEIKKPV